MIPKQQEHYTPFSLLMAFIIALGAFLFGYNAAVIAGALSFVSGDFSLELSQETLIVSILLLGAFIGSAVTGPLTDRWGRRLPTFFIALLFLVAPWLSAIATSFDALLFARFLCGVAVGAISVIVPLYLAEIATDSRRGAFVSLNQLFITIGVLVAYLINYLFSDTSDWRTMFLLGMLPAAVQCVTIFFFPESPRWLLAKGKIAKASAAFAKLRRDRVWEIEIKKGRSEQKSKGIWHILWQPHVKKALVIGIILSILQQVTGINVITFYAPKILREAGFASISGAILATVAIGVINLIATLFSTWLLDRAGRRPLLLISFVGMALSFFIISLAFLTGAANLDWIALIACFLFIASFSLGSGPVTWVVLSEIFPSVVRGKAMAIATLANWLFNYLVALTFLDFKAYLGMGWTLSIYGFMGLFGWLFTWRYIPETKGRMLD